MQYFRRNVHFLEFTCPVGFQLTSQYGSANKICGDVEYVEKTDKTWGFAGEKAVGGPNWPTAESTQDESVAACAAACDRRNDCSHFIWFDDNGCRTQNSCDTAVDGYAKTHSYICEQGKMFYFVQL